MSGEGIEPGKLFVGGLSWETTKENLEMYFREFGEVADSIIMFDAVTKKPRGFGFVTFQDPSKVKEVLGRGPHVLDGKTIDPKPATNKSTVNQGSSTGMPTKKVFVGGLSAETTEDEVRSYFNTVVAPNHQVTDVDIKMDKTTNRMRGFGFVTFDSEEIVEKLCASAVRFHNICGKQVELKKAEQKGAGHQQPGGFGGRHTMMGSYQNQGYGGGYNGAMYPSAGQSYQQQRQYPQQYEGYAYGSQSAGYGGAYGGAHAGGYGGAASYDYSQSAAQQPVNSYQDQSYGAAGYNTSRTVPASQQQYPGYQQQQQQGYTNTAGNTGYSSRGQQPQSSYEYGGGHGLH